MKIVRSVVAMLVVAGIAAAGGCGAPGRELVSSDTHNYGSPVWCGDTVYYSENLQLESEVLPDLYRVRAGGRPELVTVHLPNCQTDDGTDRSPLGAIPIGDHELGVFMHCGPWEPSPPTVFARWDPASGQATILGTLEDGSGVAWSGDSGTVYYRTPHCPQQPPAGVVPITCLTEHDALWIAPTADGSLVFMTTRCGTDAQELYERWVVCRRDRAGRSSTVACCLTGPADVAVHGDRIVIVGRVDGKAGVWLVQSGRFKNVVEGDYSDAQFNADGTRLAVTYSERGWFSTTWSVRVIDAPRS